MLNLDVKYKITLLLEQALMYLHKYRCMRKFDKGYAVKN